MSKKPSNETTLQEITGTNRGLGKLTVADLKVLLKGEAPAKPERAKSERKPNPFYEQVIVGGREEREARAKGNKEAAAWMREKGLVPSGQAWAAVKQGERSVKRLKALNAADGLTPPADKPAEVAEPVAEAKPERKARRAKKPESAPEPEVEPEAEPEVDAQEEALATLVDGGFTEDEAKAILGR